jgi:hypothetical protein
MIWLAVLGLTVAMLAYMRHSRVTHERRLNVFVHALSLTIPTVPAMYGMQRLIAGNELLACVGFAVTTVASLSLSEVLVRHPGIEMENGLDEQGTIRESPPRL